MITAGHLDQETRIAADAQEFGLRAGYRKDGGLYDNARPRIGIDWGSSHELRSPLKRAGAKQAGFRSCLGPANG